MMTMLILARGDLIDVECVVICARGDGRHDSGSRKIVNKLTQLGFPLYENE